MTATDSSTTFSRVRRPPLTQEDYRASLLSNCPITSMDVATLPRPGTGTIPASIQFNNDGEYVTYLSSLDPTSLSRRLYATNIDNGQTKELFEPDGGGEEKDFSLEEKLRRERARMMATGVTSYAWAKGVGGDDAEGKKKQRMLIPLGGALWLLDDALGGDEGAVPRKVTETNTAGDTNDSNDFHSLPPNAPLLDAKLSADGSTVAFVADNEVYAVSANNDEKPRRLTSGARGVDGLSNGVADYVAQEELERADGFWLSPRGSLLAFESVDESHIPSYRITHQGEDKGLSHSSETSSYSPERTTCEDVTRETTVTHEEHRFPFAGAMNPAVKFGVVSTDRQEAGGDVMWFDLASVFGDDFYLAKAEWLAVPSSDEGSNDQDSNRLVVQLLDRRQQTLALVMLDCATGSMTTLHIERAVEGAWVNLNDAFRPMPSSDGKDNKMQFLWASERDGYSHLYVMEASLEDGGEANKGAGAKVVRRLTGPGEFVVEEVLAVDKDNEYIYYMGTSPDRWLERHLFRVSLNPDDANNNEPECITGSIPGQHNCVVNVKSGYFVDTVSSTTKAPISTICKLPSSSSKDLEEPEQILELHNCADADPRIASLGSALQPPTFHQFPSIDKSVTLQAALYLPDESIHGKGPYPLVVATYGGPHVQYVQDTWGMMTVDLRTQFLRANGFAVIKVDNRGSNRRGIVFEKPIFKNMGDLEVEDQVAGVQWAVENGYADKERVAVSGWSYGGYMALKCLMNRSDVFHAAISGAPVTDWALYDTAYTERYMGLPFENVEGYEKSSALNKVQDIQGSLLLCHGLLDENVLFRQSAVLVNKLIEHQKAYDLALFPSERHGPRRKQDRAFLEERILAFLQRSLGV